MENKKSTILLTVIAVATLLVAVVGATFAYFTAQGGGTSSATVVVETGTTASTSFNISKNLSIYADIDNFYEGAGSVSDTATATASWTSSSADPDESFCYNLKLNISTNELQYTVDENTAELTLTVTKNGTTVYDAIDITTATGDIYMPSTLASSPLKTSETHTIAGSTTGTTDTWVVTITLVNLSTDQEANTGKTVTGTLTFGEATCS